MGFDKKEVSCLETVLREVQNLEQTQELRVPEGMPPVDRVLGAWGQCILRSKQWEGDSASAALGMMIRVAYVSEGNEGIRTLEAWVPFHVRYDMPEGAEGTMRLLCRSRFVDARMISGEKLMVRAGICILAEGTRACSHPVRQPGDTPEDVQLLRREYMLRLPVETGEKQFSLEEDLTVPQSVPKPKRVISCSLEPEIAERKVLGERLAFRGSGKAHLLYETEDGSLGAWDFELPFSQFAQLEQERSQDAAAEFWPVVISLEAGTDTEGKLHLSAEIVVQYLVDDLEKLQLTQDAYSNLRELTVHREQIAVPAVLENRREVLNVEQTVPMDADVVLDVQICTDFPRQNRQGEELTLEVQGVCQMIVSMPGGILQGYNARFRGSHSLRAHADSMVRAVPGIPSVRVQTGQSQIAVQLQIPVDMRVDAGGTMEMVTALEAGELRRPDPARPSLVLCRPGKQDLWQLARQCGSTVEAIREANGLEGEPEQNRILLIPVI